jgi:hypothetical protein
MVRKNMEKMIVAKAISSAIITVAGFYMSSGL